MKLLIDAGNTRIKWALVKGKKWLRTGALPIGEAGGLSELFSGSEEIRQIWVSNVSGEKVAQHIRDIGRDKARETHFVVAQDIQCGVRNGYSKPAQLGSDRWAALIAARHLMQGKCLVVNSGTATTIDTLTKQGKFLGGLIVPGVELMQHSLIAATEHLRSGRGKFVRFPLNSADAMHSGAIQASCGAIERQYTLLNDSSAVVVLSGGAARLLLPYLQQGLFGLPPRVVDNLVLHGLLLIAQESG